tara:strand:+ start:484 stop:1086 length:603 start_codon:yes stop_codon:yes gene_type:complete
MLKREKLCFIFWEINFMALLKTPLCDFGKKLIPFKLKDINENEISVSNILGENGTLIMFICNHCPYVQAIIKDLVKTTKSIKTLGINSIAIMPNDYIKYPEDNLKNMKIFSELNDFDFPYLIDESQKIAKLYDAICTPDFFGFNKNNELQYRGRITELKNLEPVESSENELFIAMKEISLTGKGPLEQNPSMGCSIKWKL